MQGQGAEAGAGALAVVLPASMWAATPMLRIIAALASAALANRAALKRRGGRQQAITRRRVGEWQRRNAASMTMSRVEKTGSVFHVRTRSRPRLRQQQLKVKPQQSINRTELQFIYSSNFAFGR
jgi:hypothetical protein